MDGGCGRSKNKWQLPEQRHQQQQRDVSDPRYKAIPPTLGNTFPLDAPNGSKNVRSSFGYPTTTCKVVSRKDGHLHCLRRVDSVKSASHKIAQFLSDRWASDITMPSQRAVLDHPGLVRFYQCFVANHAVFLIHQYCQNSIADAVLSLRMDLDKGANLYSCRDIFYRGTRFVLRKWIPGFLQSRGAAL